MVKFQSAQFDNVSRLGTNKTGAAMVIGGVYALDVARTDASSTDADKAVGNVVAAATANLRGILVVALEAVPIGGTANFLVKGRTKVLVDGTTDVAALDRLIPQNGSPNLVKQGATSLVNPCGLALEAQTTDAGTLTDVLFDGETWKGERAAS